MKALTLYQPWASLVALGVKTVETRSWRPPVAMTGQRLAIHAGKRQVHSGKFLFLARQALIKGLITPEQEKPFRALDVPFGEIVATCVLVQAKRTEDRVLGWAPERGWALSPDGRHAVADVELPFGDYSPGRYSWLLDDIKATTERCPFCWGTVGEGWDEVHGRPVDECGFCWPYDGDSGVEHSYPSIAAARAAGAGRYPEPIPVRGRQGLWNWEP